jgi:hypothetical protein
MRAVLQAIREAYASALGDLAACCRHDMVPEVASSEKRPAKKQQLDKALAGAFKACLVQPFMDAAAAGKRDTCTALAIAWVSYCSGVQQRYTVEPDWVVEVAVLAVQTLEACYKAHSEASAKAAAVQDAELGISISGQRLCQGMACARGPSLLP